MSLNVNKQKDHPLVLITPIDSGNFDAFLRAARGSAANSDIVERWAQAFKTGRSSIPAILIDSCPHSPIMLD